MDNAHKVVSSEAEELILVDTDDNEIAYLSKAACHDGDGVLHRAFSLFLFNDDGELLLQQRGKSKRLWPDYWSNSCCSHPRRGESMQVATSRRLRDELDIKSSLDFVYRFSYQAEFDGSGSENELCHVYLGKIDGLVKPNENEIENIRFVAVGELAAELEASPERFTPWLKLEWQALLHEHTEKLANYCSP